MLWHVLTTFAKYIVLTKCFKRMIKIRFQSSFLLGRLFSFDALLEDLPNKNLILKSISTVIFVYRIILIYKNDALRYKNRTPFSNMFCAVFLISLFDVAAIEGRSASAQLNIVKRVVASYLSVCSWNPHLNRLIWGRFCSDGCMPNILKFSAFFWMIDNSIRKLNYFQHLQLYRSLTPIVDGKVVVLIVKGIFFHMLAFRSLYRSFLD